MTNPLLLLGEGGGATELCSGPSLWEAGPPLAVGRRELSFSVCITETRLELLACKACTLYVLHRPCLPSQVLIALPSESLGLVCD